MKRNCINNFTSMMHEVITQRKARSIHRWLAPLAAAPLQLTASTSSLFNLILEQGIDAFSLLKIHNGQFGPLKLQPAHALLLVILTIIVKYRAL